MGSNAIPSTQEILDAIYADDIARLKEFDVRPYFSKSGYLGFVISKDGLQDLDYNEDIFAFLKSEFPDVWSEDVSWSDLGSVPRRRVLEAIWKDQESECWLPGLFVLTVADHLGRSAMLLFRHDGDYWEADTSTFLGLFKTLSELHEANSDDELFYFAPNADDVIARRIATQIEEAPGIHQKAQAAAQRAARLTTEVQQVIDRHTRAAIWERVNAGSLTPMGNGFRYNSIKEYVTDHFLERGDLPLGIHRIPMLSHWPIQDRDKANPTSFFEATFLEPNP